LFIVIVAAILYMCRLILRYRVLYRHKSELGLQSRCQAFIEMVKYQSTIGTSSELSVAPKYFSGKITRSKQLADRPLSLPGLTATCSEFLQEVAEVFSGKVVICIDEVDKDTETAQIFELLKGIKGILGQDNTHFILTVSEDAMTFFNERLSRERSLIESSFEEIVYLDRLSCGLARNVICQSLGMMYVEEEPFLRNSLMLWLFAAGNSPEIKRNLFTCYAQRVKNKTSSPVQCLALLYLAMLNSMLTTTAPKEAAGLEEQYKFLICIEALIGAVGSASEATAPSAFLQEVTGILAAYFGQSFGRLLESRLTDRARTRQDDETAITIYFGQLVEALLGALLFAIAGPDGQRTVNRSNLDSMIYIYKYVPINAQFAFYGLNSFLRTRLREFGVDLKELLSSPRAPIEIETAANSSPSSDTSTNRTLPGPDAPGELRVAA